MKSAQAVNQCKSLVPKSYDIVKAHGAEINLEAKEREGAKFIITLSDIS